MSSLLWSQRRPDVPRTQGPDLVAGGGEHSSFLLGVSTPDPMLFVSLQSNAEAVFHDWAGAAYLFGSRLTASFGSARLGYGGREEDLLMRSPARCGAPHIEAR